MSHVVALAAGCSLLSVFVALRALAALRAAEGELERACQIDAEDREGRQHENSEQQVQTEHEADLTREAA